jgi:TonB family protein
MSYLGPSLRREKRKERPLLRIAAAVAASLLANALALWGLAVTGAFRLGGATSPSRVALAPVAPSQWEANRRIDGVRPPEAPSATPRPPEAKPEPQPEKDAVSGQVVDVPPSQDSRRPKDSRFLSERNNTVERETRSRFAGTRKWENTLPRPQEGEPGPAKPGSAEAREAAPPSRPDRPGASNGDRVAILTPDGSGDLALPKAHPDRQASPGAAPDGLPAPDGAPPRAPGELDPRLRPDAASLARIAGGPSPDRLDGVEEGEETALNTVEFKYAGFYVRVGKAIYREWDPNRVYNERDPARTYFPSQDRTTGVEVVLDPEGALEFVKIQRPSGLDFLDHEIVRAARAAAPFPNPPAGMIAQDGKVHVFLSYTLIAARLQGRFEVVPPPASAFPLLRAYPQRDPAMRR